MEGKIVFIIVLIVLLVLIVFLAKKFGMLYDDSTASPKPYSYSKVQLAWWSMLILGAFTAVIICTGQLPDLGQSSVILLGISSLTAASARLIDISDDKNVQAAQTAQALAAQSAVPGAAIPSAPVQPLLRNQPGDGFLLDILSDTNGISVHRFQAAIVNLVIGLWFAYKVYTTISSGDVNNIIPSIDNSNLALLGLSAGTYAVMKTAENK